MSRSGSQTDQINAEEFGGKTVKGERRAEMDIIRRES
jgi:hypothetical protein